MVAAPRAVRVEVAPLDAVLNEVLPRRAGQRDRPGRRDVVSRDGVAKQRQHPRAPDVADLRFLRREVLEERRLLNVRRVRVPGVQFALRHGDLVPHLVAGKDVRVLLLEHLRLERVVDGLADLLLRRPDVAQVHGLARRRRTDWLGLKVDVHRARQRIGDDERRRGQVVDLRQRVDAPLKVAVAAQDRGHNQVLLLHRLGDILLERAAVADAGRAAVANNVIAQRLQVGHQPGFGEVAGHDLRAGGEAGLDVRRHAQPQFDGLFRQKPRADHHRRVGGVGAACDGRNDNRTVRHSALAAIGGGCLLPAMAVLLQFAQHLAEGLLAAGQRDAILRAPGAGDARLHIAEVQLQRGGVDRVGRVVGAEHPLRLGVPLDEVNKRLAATRAAQVVECLIVDREQADGRAVLRRHVGNRRAVGEAERADARPEVLHKLADHAALA